LTLVIDASAAIDAGQFRSGFDRFSGESLVAPPLFHSEIRSTLHEAIWRGVVDGRRGLGWLRTIEDAPIRIRTHRLLSEETWRVADDMGWTKTYHAEYLALARLLRCQMVTTDLRLRRGTERLGYVVTPKEL
jgi:predicted nucleic acid-binding protein